MEGAGREKERKLFTLLPAKNYVADRGLELGLTGLESGVWESSCLPGIPESFPKSYLVIVASTLLTCFTYET